MKKERHSASISDPSLDDQQDAIASAVSREQAKREILFSELFRTHYSQLFSGVYAIIRNYTDAEDVMQQTSVVLWAKFDGYREGTSFVAWAFSVARFEALNFLKRERRYRKHFSEAFQMRLAATLAGVRVETADLRNDLLKKCVEKLPEK